MTARVVHLVHGAVRAELRLGRMAHVEPICGMCAPSICVSAVRYLLCLT